VLHHTPDTPGAIEEVRRVLRPGGTALVMLYHRRSLLAFLVWLRYGLFRGRPLSSVGALLARHMESPGTKAYTGREVQQMFRGFRRVRVQPILTPYDTRRPLYPLLRYVLPNAVGWFLFIEAVK
jgi:SAM-dependent methyltransferase